MSTIIPPYFGSNLIPAFSQATVADIMHPGVMSCSPDVPLSMVAEIMAAHSVHAVVVAGIAADHLVWGVITDTDLVRVAPDGIDGRRAEDITASPPVVTTPATPLPDVARTMSARSATHLVVVDRERPVGVISTLDIARALAWGGI